MAKDINIEIDGKRLNVRVGVIMRHKDKVVIEISTAGRNSVVPGGRIHICEASIDALEREVIEEMNFKIDKTRAKQLEVFENFFKYDGKEVHEIYFLYEYVLSDEEFSNLKFEQNKDNATTFFTLVSKSEIARHNLLPLSLHKIINS